MKRKMCVVVCGIVWSALLVSNAQAGLLAQFPFDSDFDSVVGGVTGTPVGNAEIINAPPSDVQVGAGAMHLPGTTKDGITASDPLDPGLGDWTFTAWVRRDGDHPLAQEDANQRSNILTKGFAINFFILNGQLRTFMATAGPTGGHLNMAGSNLGVEEWHHVALVLDRSSDQAIQYVDGVVDDADGLSPTKDVSNPDFSLGFQGDQRPLNGLIDDVGVWNEALDEQTIQYIMANGVPEPATLALLGLGGLLLRRRA